jgi:hypothetical protein
MSIVPVATDITNSPIHIIEAEKCDIPNLDESCICIDNHFVFSLLITSEDQISTRERCLDLTNNIANPALCVCFGFNNSRLYSNKCCKCLGVCASCTTFLGFLVVILFGTAFIHC